MQKKLPFFRLLCLELYFMVANLVKLNVADLKILEKSQEQTHGEVLVKLQAFIPQFHLGYFRKITIFITATIK